MLVGVPFFTVEICCTNQPISYCSMTERGLQEGLLVAERIYCDIVKKREGDGCLVSSFGLDSFLGFKISGQLRQLYACLYYHISQYIVTFTEVWGSQLGFTQLWWGVECHSWGLVSGLSHYSFADDSASCVCTTAQWSDKTSGWPNFHFPKKLHMLEQFYSQEELHFVCTVNGIWSDNLPKEPTGGR